MNMKTGYFFATLTMILAAYMPWGAEAIVVSFGLIHGFGGASVAVNLATIAYISDISTQETKVWEKFIK